MDHAPKCSTASVRRFSRGGQRRPLPPSLLRLATGGAATAALASVAGAAFAAQAATSLFEERSGKVIYKLSTRSHVYRMRMLIIRLSLSVVFIRETKIRYTSDFCAFCFIPTFLLMLELLSSWGKYYMCEILQKHQNDLR